MGSGVRSSRRLADQSTVTVAGDDVAAPPDRAASVMVVHSLDRSAVGRRIALPRPGELLTFGRSVDGPGCIADPRLSREHARVVWDLAAKSYRIGDSDSANGTRLNGERVVSATLQRHDVLRLGDTLLVVEEEVEGTPSSQRLKRAARSGLSVLILGETGTGKELLARSLHDASARKGPFVPVNCAALPQELISAELFGHVRGAFSGAKGGRSGLFATASQGTLFLDEIGDMPLEVQPALLRALQERMIRPVGSDREVSIDARVVAATHHDLASECESGAFRNDLYARLAQVVLHAPPLRERRSEILSLAEHFAKRKLGITADAAEAMVLWKWPRNIRELKTLVESFCALSDSEMLSLDGLREHNAPIVDAWKTPPSKAKRPTLPRSSVLDAAALTALLAEANGNVTVVAKGLGLSRTKLYRIMERLGVSPDGSRAVTVPEGLGRAQGIPGRRPRGSGA